jgi:16S rRNA processing protein RimM
MEFIEIGQAVNTHGLKGELKIESWSDFDEIRYTPGNTVYLEKRGEMVPVTVKSFRVHKGYSLVAFEELPEINAVIPYKGCIVYVNADDRQELEEGEYYFDELIGLTAVDEDGKRIDEVISVEETNGAQDNLRIRKEDGKEVLVPNVPAFVTDVDLDQGIIVIHVIEGLL